MAVDKLRVMEMIKELCDMRSNVLSDFSPEGEKMAQAVYWLLALTKDDVKESGK